jgi:hypothetical protein
VHIREVTGETPNTVNASVARTRRYLTGREVEKLIEAARKHGRYGHRDATMILIAYRHGLRASELCDLQWHQVELNAGRLHVRRAKRGTPSVHSMQGDEIRALRRLQREQGPSSHVFMTERDGPMAPKAFHALFGRIGARAKMQFPIHPHMLRHGCGFALANAGHDTRSLQAWLGTKISSTPCGILSWRRTGSRISGGGRQPRSRRRPLVVLQLPRSRARGGSRDPPNGTLLQLGCNRNLKAFNRCFRTATRNWP